jgi:hypothetical protein
MLSNEILRHVVPDFVRLTPSLSVPYSRPEATRFNVDMLGCSPFH